MKKIIFTAVITLLLFVKLSAQQPDKNEMPGIQGVKLFLTGHQDAYPIIKLNTFNSLELHFDDLDGGIKNYNYTYVLCDANWQPATISPFDYLQGFTQGKLMQYRNSSVAKTKYVHYQAMLPEKNCAPKLGGNYLLKVYVNGDTSKLAFSRRVLVLDDRITVGAKITQPFNTQLFRTHQKLQFTIDKTKLNIANPQQQLKVVVLQNFRWDNAVMNIQPTFMRNNAYEYNNETTLVFPGGRPYRWVDLRSFRFQSERVDSVSQTTQPFSVWLRPDMQRTGLRYVSYVDLNGSFEISTTDVNNPWTQGDYANVHFTFVPKSLAALGNRKVYIAGELATGTCDNNICTLDFNADKGVFEKTMLLKNGYYYYTYVTKAPGSTTNATETADTEGDFAETENTYTILVYYRSLSDRADQLVGALTVDSRNLTQQ